MLTSLGVVLVAATTPGALAYTCQRIKMIRNGAMAGEYELREENSMYCGDGCLYMKHSDPLSFRGQSFGYCMEFTNDCSCAGNCEVPPTLDPGSYGGCKDKDGNPVDITDESVISEGLEEGSKCTIICNQARSLGEAVNSRYDEITCTQSMWTDRFTDPLPANIKSVCEWREKLCHPVWTWNVPKEGVYNCKYENNTAIILDTTVLNHQNVPVGVPAKTKCELECNDKTLDKLAKLTPQSSITCEKFSNDMGWRTSDGNTLLLESLEYICFGCKAVPEVKDGAWKNCKMDGQNIEGEGSMFPNTTRCELECISGSIPSGNQDFTSIDCKVGDSIGWQDNAGHIIPVPVPDICNTGHCKRLKIPKVTGGRYINCELDGISIPGGTNSYASGTSCLLSCDRDDAGENTVNEDSRYDKITCKALDNKGWVDNQGEQIPSGTQVCSGHRTTEGQDGCVHLWEQLERLGYRMDCTNNVGPETRNIYEGVKCDLQCMNGIAQLQQADVETIECKKIDFTFKWMTRNNDLFKMSSVDDKQCMSKCPEYVALFENGAWNCEGTKVYGGLAIGSTCIQTCIVDPNVGDGGSIDASNYIRVICDPVGWLDRNQNPIGNRTEFDLTCPIKGAELKFIISSTFGELGIVRINRKRTVELTINNATQERERSFRISSLPQLPQLDDDNMNNLTETTEEHIDTKILRFALVKGVWFFKVWADEKYYPKYMFLTIEDYKNRVENIELDYRGELIFEIYKAGTQGRDGCGEKGCKILSPAIECQGEEVDDSMRKQTCQAMLYDNCMSVKTELDFKSCDEFRTERPDYDKCQDAKEMGINSDVLEQFASEWNKDLSNANNLVDGNIFLTVIPKREYRCTVSSTSDFYKPVTRTINMQDAKQTEIFHLSFKESKEIRIEYRDDYGNLVTNLTIIGQDQKYNNNNENENNIRHTQRNTRKSSVDISRNEETIDGTSSVRVTKVHKWNVKNSDRDEAERNSYQYEDEKNSYQYEDEKNSYQYADDTDVSYHTHGNQFSAKVSPDGFVTLPFGDLFIRIQKEGYEDEGHNITIDANTDQTFKFIIHKLLPVTLKIIDEITDEVAGTTFFVQMLRSTDETLKHSEAKDDFSEFKSEIFDKKQILKSGIRDEKEYTGEFERQFSPHKDQLNFTSGIIIEETFAGQWCFDISTHDKNKRKNFLGFLKNEIYKTKNYMDDYYFLQIYKEAFDRPLKRRGAREIVLSTAVYDDDCFKLCKGRDSCVKNHCKSLDLDDKIELKVTCMEGTCKQDETEQLDNFVNPNKIILNEKRTTISKQIVTKGRYEISCKKLDDDDYLKPPIHTTKVLEENIYFPCLLYKKLQKSRKEDYGIKFDPKMKLALGWGNPRIEISSDFNLNVVIFNKNKSKAECSILSPGVSPCHPVSRSSIEEAKESTSLEVEDKIKSWFCSPEGQNVVKSRNRCCQPEGDFKMCEMDKPSDRGLGFETILIGEKTTKEDRIVLVYVTQAYSREGETTFKDAGIEVSIQYNDGKEEKVELVTIQDSYLKEDKAVHNVMLLKCINIDQSAGKVTLSDPANNWMHYHEHGDQDLGHIFGNFGKSGYGAACENCMELFCPDTEVQDIMLNNMEKDKLREHKVNCCCCAELLNEDLHKHRHHSTAEFKCPYTDDIGDITSECDQLKAGLTRRRRVKGRRRGFRNEKIKFGGRNRMIDYYGDYGDNYTDYYGDEYYTIYEDDNNTNYGLELPLPETGRDYADDSLFPGKIAKEEERVVNTTSLHSTKVTTFNPDESNLDDTGNENRVVVSQMVPRKFNESGIKSSDSIFNQAENLGPVNNNDKENEKEGPVLQAETLEPVRNDDKEIEIKTPAEILEPVKTDEKEATVSQAEILEPENNADKENEKEAPVSQVLEPVKNDELEKEITGQGPLPSNDNEEKEKGDMEVGEDYFIDNLDITEISEKAITPKNVPGVEFVPGTVDLNRSFIVGNEKDEPTVGDVESKEQLEVLEEEQGMDYSDELNYYSSQEELDPTVKTGRARIDSSQIKQSQAPTPKENEGQKLTEKFTKQFINMDHRLAIGQPDN